MAILLIVLPLVLVMSASAILAMRRSGQNRLTHERFSASKLSYACFLLTLQRSKQRQRKFFHFHPKDIPITTVYGPDVYSAEVAEGYRTLVDPHYFNVAVQLSRDKKMLRPDHTYFNIGAIGAYFGHLKIWHQCEQPYALVFEDNVLVKDPQFYAEVERILQSKKDDFEVILFHSMYHLPVAYEGELDQVAWTVSAKCYLIHIPNMRRYFKDFYPMDHHIDIKFEDIVAAGARVYYRDMRKYIAVDRGVKSTINHTQVANPDRISRRFPHLTYDDMATGF